MGIKIAVVDLLTEVDMEEVEAVEEEEDIRISRLWMKTATSFAISS